MSSALPIPRSRRRVVERVNRGVFLARPARLVPPGGMIDCLNVRVKDGTVRRENAGWETFPPGSAAMGGPAPVNLGARRVMLITQFFTRSGAQVLIFATDRDLFRFDDGTEAVFYITPTYATGTVDVAADGVTVTGTGTAFDTVDGPFENVKAGDMMHVGSASEADPGEDWIEVQSVGGPTSLTLASAYPGAPLVGQPYVVRRRPTGDWDDLWDDATFLDAQGAAGDKDMWYAVNGREWVKWDGGSTYASYLDVGFVARTLLVHKNLMVAGYVIESGENKTGTIRSSVIAEPENFSGDGAIEQRVINGVDPILSLRELADLVIPYAERNVPTMQFVGGSVGWVVRTAIPGIGLFAAETVMDFGDFHEFLSHDTAYRFNGVGLEPYGGHLFRDVLRKQSPNRGVLGFAHIDEENGEIQWSIPLTTDPGSSGEQQAAMAFTEHYLEERKLSDPVPFTIRDLPATAMGFYDRVDSVRFSDLPNPFSTYSFKWDDRFFEAAFPLNLFGDENGNVYILGTADSKNGASITSYARFGRLPIADGRRKGLLKVFEPFVECLEAADYDLDIRFYGADFADGPSTLRATVAYDLAHGGIRWVNPRIERLMFEPEYRTVGVDRPWTASGFAYEGQEGKRR